MCSLGMSDKETYGASNLTDYASTKTYGACYQTGGETTANHAARHTEGGANLRNGGGNQPNGYSLQPVPCAQPEPALNNNPFKQIGGNPHARQVMLVLLASTTLVMNGSILAFPSVIISDLLENNSTLFGTTMILDDTQQDLLGSVMSLGAFVGVWAIGLSMGPFGRIRVFIALAVMGFISWVGVALAPNPGLCLLFRAIGGVVYGGVSVSGVTYIVEITDDVLRSSLTLLASGSITTGQFIGVIPAHWLRYYYVSFINCIYPIAIFFFAVFILPESPSVLVMHGQEKKAREVLQRLNGKDSDVDTEIEVYKNMNKQHQNTNVLQSLGQRDVLVRLGIVSTLFFFQVFSGYTIFVAQTARIIQDSGGTVEASLATILVQSAQLVGICITMRFVNRLGRRGCLLLSHASMVVAVGALAFFTLSLTTEDSASMMSKFNESLWDSNTTGQINHEGIVDTVPESSQYGWVPLVCIMMAQFGSGFGVQNVPFILASEYFPTAIRPRASSICISVAMVLGIASLQLYTPLQQLLTQTGLMFFHCSVSLVALPFTYYCVQETVGKKVG